MKKTIAEELGVTDFPFEIRNKQGNLIYSEWQNSWSRWEHNEKGWLIYYEDSNKFWERWDYDNNGNQIYYENSDGEIIDNRPKPQPQPMTIEINGKKYKLIEI